MTLTHEFGLLIECILNSLSFDADATPSQITLIDQQIKNVPFNTIKGNGCPAPIITFTTSFEGQGISIVETEGTGAKLRFDEVLL